jgi:hypothetical protein
MMKLNFNKYGRGEFCSFDLTHHLIRELSPHSNSPYKVGCLMGLSSSRKLVPFGLVITDVETKERYKTIFKMFFQMMEGYPSVLITDEAASIIHSIKDLEEDGEIDVYRCLDVWRILKNLKAKLQFKSHLKFFANLARAQN